MRGAEEKQRVIEMEKQLKELSATIERLKMWVNVFLTRTYSRNYLPLSNKNKVDS